MDHQLSIDAAAKRRRARRWMAIGGVALAALLVGSVIAGLAALRGDAELGFEPTPSPVVEQPTQSPAPTPRPTPSPAPTADPSPSSRESQSEQPEPSTAPSVAAAPPPGSTAIVVVDELRVRAEPGLSSAVTGRLLRGAEVFVTAAPRSDADGLTWAYVQGEWRTDGDGSGGMGFVAIGDDSGPFLQPVEVECPTGALDVEVIARMTPWARLVCFGSEPLTLTAFDDPENYGFGGLCNCVAEPAWLVHPFALRVLSPSPDQQHPWLFVRLAPGVEDKWPPEPGRVLRVAGHFDDPNSASCEFRTPDPEIDPDGTSWFEDTASTVLRCRQQFVLIEIAVASEG